MAQPVNWKITNLDTNEVFEPQFPIDDAIGVSINEGSTLSERSRFGFQDTLLQWKSGKAETLTFPTRLFAEHYGDDIQKKVEQLRSLAKKDERLGRSPICLFVYGFAITEYVMVESVNPVLRGVLPSGSSRDVVFNITLKKYTPFSQKPLDPSRPAKESYYLVASAAEQSYEALALRFYGDPLLGDRLRKRHPAHPTAPRVGQYTKIPSREVIQREAVEPSSHVFSRADTETETAYQRIVEARGQPTVISTV